jgi:6-phosphogluconolactonase (cycloisomerase 2 family)
MKRNVGRGLSMVAGALSWAFSLFTLAASPESGGQTSSFVYVVDQGAESLGAYRIDAATGALTPLPGVAPKTDGNPYGVAIDAKGRWLFVAHGEASTVTVFARKAATGVLSPEPAARMRAGDYAVAVAADAQGRFVYVSSMVSDAVAAFSVGPTGSLAPVTGSPFATAGRPSGVALHPSGGISTRPT